MTTVTAMKKTRKKDEQSVTIPETTNGHRTEVEIQKIITGLVRRFGSKSLRSWEHFPTVVRQHGHVPKDVSDERLAQAERDIRHTRSIWEQQIAKDNADQNNSLKTVLNGSTPTPEEDMAKKPRKQPAKPPETETGATPSPEQQEGTDAKPEAAKPKPKKAKQKTTEEGRDRFGSELGSYFAKANAVLTKKPKTMKQIMEESGIPDTCYNHFRKLIEQRFVEKTDEGYKLTGK